MVKFFSSPVRNGLKDVLQHVRSNLLLATPFIKAVEARWVCDELARNNVDSSVCLQVLTDVRSENVLNGSLDVRALSIFAELLHDAVVVNVPRIHAKVYIADNHFALVTSANLTPSGMERNFEYGVGFDDPSIVNRIREDLQAYARLGNALDKRTLSELTLVADDVSTEFRRLQRQASAPLRRRFNEKLRAANHEFLRAQVGQRSAHSLFSEAILYALSFGRLSTLELHPTIQKILPDLCDDSTELIIDGERFGKKWKHAVRNAQQSLKRSGQIEFDGENWMLARR